MHCALLTAALQTNEDSVYEQDVLRNPSSVKPWLTYYQLKARHGTMQEQAFILERACIQLPRSYKLWKMVSFVMASGSSYLR